MKGSGCLKGCAIGCAVVAVLVVLLMAIGGFQVARWMGNFDDAIETRASLEESYPTLETFQPALDGRIPAERLEVFLRVREGLREECEALSEVVTSMDGAIGEMNALEEAGEDQGLKDVPWMAIGKTVGSAFSLAPAISRFAKARNEALLTQQMGFGEYAWIFTAVYHEPGQESVDASESGIEFGDMNERARGGLVEMMRRTLVSIEALEAPSEEHLALAGFLRQEVAALDADRSRPPWFDGIPASLASSIEPMESDLAALACPAVRQFELARHRKRGGMSVTVD